MSKIHTRFNILKAEKELRDERKYNYLEIGEATGVNPNTLTEYANNRSTRFDERILIALCEFFDCELGELLVIVPGERP